MNCVESKCILWISDIFWPMNNAVYTALINKSKLHKVNFFDEGMVLYWLEKMSAYRIMREHIKFILLGFKSDLRFTFPKLYPFYNNEKNGSVYALHTELLREKEKTEKIKINQDLISMFDEKLDNVRSPSDLRIYKGDNSAALLLAQPYYRVANREDFKGMLNKATKYLKSYGCDDMYVKLHPSEGMDVFNEFYEPMGFKNIFSESRSPIEAKLHKLPIKTILISFNSSALLNSRVFGFKGKIISYGLDWISSQYKFQRSIKFKQEQLFTKNGVEVVMFKD